MSVPGHWLPQDAVLAHGGRCPVSPCEECGCPLRGAVEEVVGREPGSSGLHAMCLVPLKGKSFPLFSL